MTKTRIRAPRKAPARRGPKTEFGRASKFEGFSYVTLIKKWPKTVRTSHGAPRRGFRTVQDAAVAEATRGRRRRDPSEGGPRPKRRLRESDADDNDHDDDDDDDDNDDGDDDDDDETIR